MIESLLRIVRAVVYVSGYFCIMGNVYAEDSAASRAMQEVFRSYHETYLTLFPIEATNFGDNRYNDRLMIDIAPDFLAKERQFYRSTLEKLVAVDQRSCTEVEQLMAKILKYELEVRLEGMTFQHERIPLHQFDGLHLFFGQLGSGTGSQPFKSVKDYESWLQRIDGFCIWLRAAKDQFQTGIRDGYVLPRSLVVKMIPQFSDPSIASEKIEDCLFWGPIKSLPDTFSRDDQDRLKRAFETTLRDKLIPAYKEFGKFLEIEYLPKSRATSGLSSLPGGEEQYRYWVRYWTTTALTPHEIYSIGESEVARILGEMKATQAKMGFQGSLPEFFSDLRSNPALMPYTEAKQVLADFASIQAKIEPQLDRLFLSKPKTRFEIRRTEAFREATASAEYMPGSSDGRRPGIFYVPIPEVSKFNVTSGMESLFLHEAIPGHHYQVSLQQENASLPEFAKFLWYGAYGEGWALYCETLGEELGLYTDPKQKIGALGDEMHRAIRLVVDVGLHVKGWSREKAIDYMMANEAISEQAAVAEIERYMAMPGQALSYKIGQLKLRELRARYEKKLKDKFSLAQFHHQILKDGGMPLTILEGRLDTWAEKQMTK